MVPGQSMACIVPRHGEPSGPPSGAINTHTTAIDNSASAWPGHPARPVATIDVCSCIQSQP
jgi:hypothetical protein